MLALLADGYAKAVEGTSWAELARELKARASEDAGPSDWLELREIEDRGVASVWPAEGLGRAWVWSRGRWKEAPGLLTKPGYRLGRYQFKREFPAADGDALFKLIEDFLGEAEFSNLKDPPLDPRLMRDRALMDAGYEATVSCLERGIRAFPNVLLEVWQSLGCEYVQLRPYVARWYLQAVEEHGPFPNSTYQPVVDAILHCVDTALAEWQSAGHTSTNRAHEDKYSEFLWQLPRALSAFAEQEFEQIAKKVRHTLQRAPASGTFGVSTHRNQWHEYCYHAHFGPPELDWAFDDLVDRQIDYRLEKLSAQTVLLLTAAQQWEVEEFDTDQTLAVSLSLLRRGVRTALDRLALQTDCMSYDG